MNAHLPKQNPGSDEPMARNPDPELYTTYGLEEGSFKGYDNGFRV